MPGGETVAALREEVSALRRELSVVREQAQRCADEQSFRALRSDGWSGLGIQCEKVAYPAIRCAFLPDDVLLRLGSGGRGNIGGKPARSLLPARSSVVTPTPSLTGERQQVAPEVYSRSLLRFANGTRPIWDRALWDVYAELQAANRTLSPPAYPHAAEDVAMAAKRFLGRARMPQVTAAVWSSYLLADLLTCSLADLLLQVTAAVWSSITPWMEQTLLGLGVASVTTVDYNEPMLAEGTPAALSTLSVQGLARAYAAKRRFDLIVAFSGIEHDGLGRYGDPVHPDGDLAAMAELGAFLSPSGILLLGVPTAAKDDLYFPNHRIYGPIRLPMLLRGFRLLGRVWAGRVARAGLSRPHVDPLLYRDQHCTFNARLEQRFGPQTSFNWPPCDLVADGLVREGTRQRSVSNGLQDWQYQPVLVLQKAAD